MSSMPGSATAIEATTVLRKALSSGVTLIHEHIPGARTVAMGVFVHSGAAHETEEESGVSHFLEHLLFKGAVVANAAGLKSPNGQPQELSEVMGDLGSQVNAYTTDEHTSFYATCLPEVAAESLHLLLELLNPKFSSRDIALEREVILEELSQYRDDPSFVSAESGLSFFARSHPLSNSIIGSIKSLRALNEANIKRFFASRYQPHRILVSIAGDLTNLNCEEIINSSTTHLNSNSSANHSHFARIESMLPRSGFQRLYKRGINTTHIAGFWPGVAAKDPLCDAIDVWCDIVGVGSRLNWRLVEPGIADGAAISNESRSTAGYFMLTANCDPQRAPLVERELASVFEALPSNPITQDELEQSKATAMLGLLGNRETPSDRMNAHGYHWLYFDTPYSLERDCTALKAVTLEQVNAISARFQFKKGAFTVLGPYKK